MRDYLPIAEHGVIGDLRTVALVGTDGTIDWFCLPRFDSPSVFGAILDKDRGGYFRIAPSRADFTPKQLYFPDTNVLITRFLSAEGVGEVEDFMPVAGGRHGQRLVRRVLAVRGDLHFRVEVEPRFDYARARHTVESSPHGAVFRSPHLDLSLAAPVDLRRTEGGVAAEFALGAGESRTFVLEALASGAPPAPCSEQEAEEQFEEAVEYWR